MAEIDRAGILQRALVQHLHRAVNVGGTVIPEDRVGAETDPARTDHSVLLLISVGELVNSVPKSFIVSDLAAAALRS